MAEAFADWILKYNMNQKLILDIKVSLNIGLKIEVGDIIIFNQMLSDIKPYGIKYDIDAITDGNYGDMLNGQQIFPNMMVTETDKKMDHVRIRCQQMHNLSDENIIADFIEGCMYQGIDNIEWTQPPEYIANALIDDGSCSWYDVFYGCGDPYDANHIPAYLSNGNLATKEQAYDPNTPTYNANGAPYINDSNLCQDAVFDGHPHHYFMWGVVIANSIGDSDANINQTLNKTIDPDSIFYSSVNGHAYINISSIIYRWYEWYQNNPDLLISTTIAPILNIVRTETNGFLNPDGDEYNVELDTSLMNELSGTHEEDYRIKFIPNPSTEAVLGIYIPEIGYGQELLNYIKGINGSIEITFNMQYANHMGQMITTNEHTLKLNIGGCTKLGDINGDGSWNVLDIVTLANCVLAQNCELLEWNCAGDINGDGSFNVLDIVTLANCVLAQNCEDLE